MNILPINSQKNNNQNFQAVSQKYLKRAERELKKRNEITGDLLTCLSYEVFFKQISKKDAIDTLNVLKKYFTSQDTYFSHIYEIITNSNQ